jgi:polyhydroxyalkanoate synthesis regulator phasin
MPTTIPREDLTMPIALKDVVLAGIGALTLTEEKVRELLDSLVKRGDMTREQAEKAISELAQRGAKDREEFGGKISDLVSRVVSAMDYARRSDLERLEERVRVLEEKLACEGDASES